ncbi:MAG TPA: GNAT family N-acetyltransferase [Candidatus Omnitrophota bacterium]|nr:GNAT family N-acetyltransferase [Candidatus Omnitrophota bacterium]
MDQPTELSLIRLAPEPQCGHDVALRLAGDIAELLNFDEGLPKELRHPPDAPLETAESVLSFTREWCLPRNAIFHAIVVGGRAIGSISLSHVDTVEGTARSGYWLGSAHQGRGYATQALGTLVAIARESGLARLSATIPADNERSRRVWEKLGAVVDSDGGKLTAMIAL